MSEPSFESPLARETAPAGLSVSMREVTDRGMIDLRGDAGDRRFVEAVKRVLSADLPLVPRTSAAAGDITVLWLSVDQWLVLCPRRRAAALALSIQESLAGVHALAVDMSDARAIIRLEGDGAREVLMKGTPIDLAGIGVGAVRRLRFSDLAAMLHIVGDEPEVIDLYVFRSYALFAWQWLAATAGEAARVRLFVPQPAPTPEVP